MKEKHSRSYCHKISKSCTEPLFYFPLRIVDSTTDKKAQIYVNHKSSLETLLNIIKNVQIDYLSKLSKKKNHQNTKQLLLSLKDNLNLMLKEKNKKINYLKGELDFSKKKLQKIIFPSSKESKSKKENGINKNKIVSFISEKNQLQLLNFQIQNEIEKAQNEYKQKLQIYTYIKTLPFFFEVNRELFCNSNNYETYNTISGILNEIIRRVRKEFIKTVKEKMKKEFEINSATIQIIQIKNFLENDDYDGYRKYIDSEDIIPEESKEFTKSIITCQSKRNSISSNFLKQLSNLNPTSGKYVNKIIEKKIKDKYFNQSNPFTNNNNKDLFSDINSSKVANYLNMNMNINVNINLNNNKDIQESFNSSLDSDNCEDKNKKYEVDLNDNNKIIITPITTTGNNDKIKTGNNTMQTD